MIRAATLFLILQHFGYAQNIFEDIPLRNEAQTGPAVALLKSGDTYDAIRNLRRTESSGYERSVSKLLAFAYYVAGQQILFEERVKRLIAEQPEDFAPYYYLGRHVFSDVEDFERAAELFRQSVARNPKHAHSHAFLGAALSRLQKFEAAEQALDTALLLDPRSYFAHLEAAKLALTQQHYERALHHAAEAATLSSTDPDIGIV
jgi:tetratricopeptide (TPR) repeat protein